MALSYRKMKEVISSSTRMSSQPRLKLPGNRCLLLCQQIDQSAPRPFASFLFFTKANFVYINCYFINVYIAMNITAIITMYTYKILDPMAFLGTALACNGHINVFQ